MQLTPISTSLTVAATPLSRAASYQVKTWCRLRHEPDIVQDG
jgi:hypothetical protein